MSLFIKKNYEMLIIGGSAGSFPIVTKLLEKTPSNFRLPIVMCLHRLKDKPQGFKEALEIKSNLPINEPDDKDPIKVGMVFIAPSNYHLIIENKTNFSLSTTELVQYSRPSIDVLFESAAEVFGSKLIAILLSGANRDGAAGMKKIKAKGGFTVVQDPNDCSVNTMPQAAIQATQIDLILPVNDLINFIQSVH